MTSRPPRVLLVTGRLGPGGTELAVITLARGLARRGRVRPSVAVLADGGRWARELREEGLSVEELGLCGPLRSFDGLRRLNSLRRLIREREIALVHTFLFEADVYGMLAAWLARPRAIVTTRRAIKAHRPHHLRAYRCTNGLVDRIVANSEAVRRFTLDREDLEAGRVICIPNGVDATLFSSGSRARLRARFGISDEALLVGAVGTIKKVKGQDLLLDALTPRLREDPRLRVLFAGDLSRPFGGALRARAAEFGERVLLPGTLSDVPDLLAALDLFVLPSRSEGMSNALLEAMAAGCAIVATAVGGNKENLDGGRVGRLVPAEEVAALREAVLGLLDDPSERARLGARAARRARCEYSLDRMLGRTEDLYEELLGR